MVSNGFETHSASQGAPKYEKKPVKWLVADQGGVLIGALTADILWNWIYVGELWVARKSRGAGIGKRLMQLAEEFAVSENLQGLWLWTQSWQAESFYRQLGYSEFTRFHDFPLGHSRIGFRKILR